MKIEKEELGEKMYDAFMFLAIIALIACLCFADKPHTDTITEKRETVTVQDKFSELDTSEMVLIQFADTEYYLTVSRIQICTMLKCQKDNIILLEKEAK